MNFNQFQSRTPRNFTMGGHQQHHPPFLQPISLRESKSWDPRESKPLNLRPNKFDIFDQDFPPLEASKSAQELLSKSEDVDHFEFITDVENKIISQIKMENDEQQIAENVVKDESVKNLQDELSKLSPKDDPAFDAMKFQNKYLKARCDSLEKSHKKLAEEYQSQLIQENERWKLREKKMSQQLDSKQTQIHELRHTLRRMRMFLDNLPVRMRRNFYKNNKNFSANKFDQEAEKENILNHHITSNGWKTVETESLIENDSDCIENESNSNVSDKENMPHSNISDEDKEEMDGKALSLNDNEQNMKKNRFKNVRKIKRKRNKKPKTGRKSSVDKAWRRKK